MDLDTGIYMLLVTRPRLPNALSVGAPGAGCTNLTQTQDSTLSRFSDLRLEPFLGCTNVFGLKSQTESMDSGSRLKAQLGKGLKSQIFQKIYMNRAQQCCQHRLRENHFPVVFYCHSDGRKMQNGAGYSMGK